MSRYSSVIFDLDGTLIDSYDAIAISLNEIAAERGTPPFTRETVKELVGEGVERLLLKAFGSADSELLDRFGRAYDPVCCDASSLLDDVEQTIISLHEAGVKLAVCTNKPTGFSKKIVEHFGLGPYIDVVVGPDVAGSRKPDPAHVLFTLRELSASNDAALFVGDMPIDIAAARAANVHVAAIATGSATREVLSAALPDYLLERFADLLQIVAAHPVRA